MTIIKVAYVIFVFLAIAACIPQVKQLLLQKDSQGFELGTWSVWLMAQVAATIYTASIEAYIIMATSIAWGLFYAVMVSLIVYYRHRPCGIDGDGQAFICKQANTGLDNAVVESVRYN